MLYFACLWIGLSVTLVFDLGHVNIKKTLQDGGLGGCQGISDAKISMVDLRV